MDGPTVGLVGGIAGGVLGMLGALAGTYASIRNTNGPRERACMIRAAVACWLGFSAFLATLSLVPAPWRFLPGLVYIPALIAFIKWTNERQARIRAEDLGEAEHPGRQGV